MLVLCMCSIASLPAKPALILVHSALFLPITLSLSRLAVLWRVLSLHHPQVFSTAPTPACLICSSSSLPLPIGLHLKSHGEGGLHFHPSLRILEPVYHSGNRWTFSSQNPITLQLFLVLPHLLGPGNTAASVTPEPENSYF